MREPADRVGVGGRARSVGRRGDHDHRRDAGPGVPHGPPARSGARFPAHTPRPGGAPVAGVL